MAAHSHLALFRHSTVQTWCYLISRRPHKSHLSIVKAIPLKAHLVSTSATSNIFIKPLGSQMNLEMESLARLCWHFQALWYIWAWVKIKMKKGPQLLQFLYCFSDSANWPCIRPANFYSVWLHFLSIKDCGNPALQTRILWIITHNKTQKQMHFLPIEM